MEKASKAQLKRVRELMRDKGVRETAGLFVAEGLKVVRDIYRKGHGIESILVSRCFTDSEAGEGFISDASDGDTTVFEVADKDFDNISTLHNSQGIMAVVEKPDISRTVLPESGPAIFVLCDGVQDPGNIGTIIRTSVAFGVDAIIVTGETADIFNPKVVRASSGMVLDIPIARRDKGDLLILKNNGFSFLAACADESIGQDITQIAGVSKRAVVAFGSEGKGLSEEIMDIADTKFYIPIKDTAESLNVSTAAAIAIYIFKTK